VLSVVDRPAPAHAALRVERQLRGADGDRLGIAADLYRYGRDVVRRRHTWLLSVPLVAARRGSPARAVRAMWIRSRSPPR
jgi:hypothetical protein